MALRDDIPAIIDYMESKADYIKENRKIYTALEGNLGTLVKKALAATLSPDTYAVACQRIAPINILRKVADKLATIYQQHPVRMMVDGTDQDGDLLSWYEAEMAVNKFMNSADEYFSVSKVSAVMPFVHQGKPRLRALQPGKFIVWSNDPIDPTNPTHFITIHQGRDSAGQPTAVYHCYTDSEYLIFNHKGEIDTRQMSALGNIDGVNPFGKIPAVYINRSSSELVPDVDSDMLAMTMLVPLFLTDLNVGAMFTVWPIMWTKDVNIKDMAYSPKTLIQMFTDPVTGAKPEMGTIEPKMDIPNQLSLLQSQLSVWLSTKNIRPSAVGELTVDNFASGVAKMIDEGDTTEERKRHIEVFKDAEKKLWDLVANYMSPVWSAAGLIENRALFSLGSEVKTAFPDLVPMMTRGQIVRDMKEEVDARFTTRRHAIKRLNPTMSDAEIDQLIAEIDAEGQISVRVEPVALEVQDDETQEQTEDGDEDQV